MHPKFTRNAQRQCSKWCLMIVALFFVSAGVSGQPLTSDEPDEDGTGLKQMICSGLGCPGQDIDCVTLELEGTASAGVPKVLELLGVDLEIELGTTITFHCHEDQN